MSAGFLSFAAHRVEAKRSGKILKLKNKPATLLFLPLDERFTTRELFLSDAKLTPFKILTPDTALLPRQKIAPEMNSLRDWTRLAAKDSDVGIISAEMLVYGGLIASRISDDSLETAAKRLRILEAIKRENPKMRLFVSSTVTRIPAASSSEEEPDYYKQYGREIFQFSFYTHRFEVLKNLSDKIAADDFKKQIPPEILDDFLTRRRRNFEINKGLIKLVEKNVIERLVITLDDNSEYGFSKKEAAELEKLAAPLAGRVAVYAGADEAQVALLSYFVAGKNPVSVYPIYRFPQSKNLIPAFEGAPLADSVSRQIEAAGGKFESDLSKAECVLYINNFEVKETFPPQELTGSPEKIQSLEDWLKRAGINSTGDKILILADNRFYNGADAELISAVFKSKIKPENIAYAGWNTSGNTLGSAIALGVLRRKMTRRADNFLQYKKLLFTRFVEDWIYMTSGRTRVREMLRRENLTELNNENTERRAATEMKNLFNANAAQINRFLQSDFTVERVFFPWHRPFEIGFEFSRRQQ